MKQSFEAVLVRQCALTLAGMKPGSLFCFPAPSMEEPRSQTEQWDRRLCPLGLSARVLLERPGAGSALIYVCRPVQLERMLSLPKIRRFLEERGYRWGDLDCLLDQLALRLRTQDQFPHESGIFLGYPLRDVLGFIQHRGENFTCCGLWKSYGDPSAMEKCFACYRTCAARCVRLYEQGAPIEALAAQA